MSETITREWQPIRTAPMDGTQILVFTVHGDIELSSFYWMEREIYEAVGAGLFTRRLERSYEGWNSNTPTHWMPLPNPPKS